MCVSSSKVAGSIYICALHGGPLRDLLFKYQAAEVCCDWEESVERSLKRFTGVIVSALPFAKDFIKNCLRLW